MSYNRILKVAINKPLLIYSLVMLLVLCSALMIPRLQIDTDPENMLSGDEPARIFHSDVKRQFSMRDMIVVGLIDENSIYTPQALQILQQLTEQILLIEGVVEQDLLSLSVVDNIKQESNEGVRFEYLMQQAPLTQSASLDVQKSVNRLPMLANTLVSGDGQAAAIYVPIESKDESYRIAQNIREITTTFSSKLEFHITGLPVAEDQFGVEMFAQMGVAAPLAGMAIFLLLWIFFRSLPLILAPMLVAMATVIITMGSLIGMGFTVHIMSSMIAIFLMPIAVVDSVHILSEFSDRYKAGDDVKEVVTHVMGHLFKPMLLTSITSAVGFFSLLLMPIPPVRIFGAFIGLGILLAFVLTTTYIPAYICRLSPDALANMHGSVSQKSKQGRLATALEYLGKLACTKSRLVIFAFMAVFIVGVLGVIKIEINDNPVNWFKADHEIRIADKVLNAHFAGTYDAWLVFEQENEQNELLTLAFIDLLENSTPTGMEIETLQKYVSNWLDDTVSMESSSGFSQKEFFNLELVNLLDDLSFSATDDNVDLLSGLYDQASFALAEKQLFLKPDLLNWLVQLQENLVMTGLVGKVNGLPDIVRTVNRELHSGTDIDFVIPSSNNGVAQTLLQYQSSHRPQDLWHFVSKDYRQGLLWLQLTSGDNQHTSSVVDWVDNYILENPAPLSIKTTWAGKSYLNIVWQEAMVNGMLSSLLSSFVIVFFMMVVLFRSFKYGLLAMLPLTITITLIYGLIGWFGKPYDMPIAVLSALTLGLSIDFAIHFLQRARELVKQKGEVALALTDMFQEPSRAIARNAIVIAVGFTPLLFSPLVPYITVGFFLACIMAVSALVTLILLPALMTVLDK